jgi:transposase-like protein
MLQIYPNARTTPITRAEIARSQEPTGLLAERFGVSTETVRKWRKRSARDWLEPGEGVAARPSLRHHSGRLAGKRTPP